MDHVLKKAIAPVNTPERFFNTLLCLPAMAISEEKRIRVIYVYTMAVVGGQTEKSRGIHP